MLASPKQTTPLSQSVSGFVTITHPYHPLRGQQVEVVRLRRGVNPTLIIRTPNGRHMAIAIESTNYLSDDDSDQPIGPRHLLDIEGLWHVAQFIEQRR
jgi:hypothetical protein